MNDIPAVVVAGGAGPTITTEDGDELYDLCGSWGPLILGHAHPSVVEAVKTAEVLVPTVTDKIDRAVLSQAGPQLKLIANFGTGVDNIDLDTARNRSIIVTNTPGVLTEDTADMTMALILAVPRRLAEGTAYLKDNRQEWSGWSPTWMLGHRIWGKRLGIIGMGRVGRAFARKARGFDMEIHYYNRHRLSPDVEAGAIYHERVEDLRLGTRQLLESARQGACWWPPPALKPEWLDFAPPSLSVSNRR